jgi:hypothetical protein
LWYFLEGYISKAPDPRRNPEFIRNSVEGAISRARVYREFSPLENENSYSNSSSST